MKVQLLTKTNKQTKQKLPSVLRQNMKDRYEQSAGCLEKGNQAQEVTSCELEKGNLLKLEKLQLRP